MIYGSLDQTSGGYLYDRKLVEYLQKRSYGASLLQNWKTRALDYGQFDLVIQAELLLHDVLTYKYICVQFMQRPMRNTIP